MNESQNELLTKILKMISEFEKLNEEAANAKNLITIVSDDYEKLCLAVNKYESVVEMMNSINKKLEELLVLAKLVMSADLKEETV